jgi:hypothetical protein
LIYFNLNGINKSFFNPEILMVQNQRQRSRPLVVSGQKAQTTVPAPDPEWPPERQARYLKFVKLIESVGAAAIQGAGDTLKKTQ